MELVARVVDSLTDSTAAFLGMLQVPRTTHLGADTCSAARVAQEEIL